MRGLAPHVRCHLSTGELATSGFVQTLKKVVLILQNGFQSQAVSELGDVACRHHTF